MNFKRFLLLAIAFFGASAAPLVSTTSVGLNNAAVVGPTVSETLITPFHRSDSVSTPCGRSVVHTTAAAVPVVSYGITRTSGFLGTGAGVYPGVIAGGLTGIGAGVYPGAIAGGLAGTGSALYPGIVTGHVMGTAAGGAYENVGLNGVGTLGGVAGAGVLTPGLGVYPSTGVVV